MATRLNTNDPGFEAAFKALLETKRETGTEVDDAVRRILEDVRLKGDEAVIAYTREFDGFELTSETMAVTADEIEAAKAASDSTTMTSKSTTRSVRRKSLKSSTTVTTHRTVPCRRRTAIASTAARPAP